jgi:methyl-accepting chemotaxis protein
MRERFILDRKQNILFINFAAMKIDSREQVDEFAALVHENYEAQGRRLYAVVNYEGTEIAPDIVDYYGERIKELADRYGLSTVRYSSSGFTRSVLRYLGAAKDLESNTYATRDEAIRAIQEIESRTLSESRASVWALVDPRRSVLGKLMLVWLASLLIALAVWLLAPLFALRAETSAMVRASSIIAAFALLLAGAASSALLFTSVIKPLRQMEQVAQRLAVGRVFEPLAERSNDEVGSLAGALNEAARQLRRDIERLSGLYHISLMMGTGTEVSRIGELLTRKIARLLDAEMCVILLHDERERAIVAQLPAYGIDDEHIPLLRSSIDEKSGE